jgi:hypothetical protein
MAWSLHFRVVHTNALLIDPGEVSSLFSLIRHLVTTVHEQKMVIIVQVYVWGINSNYNLGLGHNSTRNNPELVEQFREEGQNNFFPIVCNRSIQKLNPCFKVHLAHT